MREKITRRRPSSALPGASGSDIPRIYEDYLLNAALEVVLSLCFIGILMDYGPPAWIAYGMAGTGAIILLARAIYLISHRDEVKEPPRWNVIPKLLILLSYGFLFYIRDQFGWMWLILAMMALLVGIRLISPKCRQK